MSPLCLATHSLKSHSTVENTYFVTISDVLFPTILNSYVKNYLDNLLIAILVREESIL